MQEGEKPVEVASRRGERDMEMLLGGLEDNLDLDMNQEDSELESREGDSELEMTSQEGALEQGMAVQDTGTV